MTGTERFLQKPLAVEHIKLDRLPFDRSAGFHNYFEFAPGLPAGKHWREDSVYLKSALHDTIEPLLESYIGDYSFDGDHEITRQGGDLLVDAEFAPRRNALITVLNDLSAWMGRVLKGHGAVTLRGM